MAVNSHLIVLKSKVSDGIYPATFTYRGNVTSYGTPTTYTVNTIFQNADVPPAIDPGADFNALAIQAPELR